MEFGCIGQHLGHSFSRIIHQRLGRYEYELREVAPCDLDSFLRQRDFRGINVTIPYKQAVIPYLDEISPLAQSIGAVNTIVERHGLLYGDNTDFGGMLALFGKLDAEGAVAGGKALILGSGGTSRTARAVLEHLGAGEIYRVSRRPQKGDISYEEAQIRHGDAKVIVNTTPCGMYPNCRGQAMELDAFRELEVLVDAVYNPLRTDLVLNALSLGVKAEGGLYMLVAQAVLAAELFLGQQIGSSVIDGIYGELLAEKENIVLIGMPGSGKTTVGRLLAAKLSRPLLDTDALIVERAGRPISNIFAQEGEAAFRRLEAEMVEEISQGSGAVIATGGGAVLNQDNVRALSRNGRLFFLDRPLTRLIPTEDRPLADDGDKLRRLYAERLPIYQKAADATIKVEGTAEEAAKAVLTRYQQ